MQKYSRLCHFCLFEFLICSFEHDFLNIEAEDLICFMEHITGNSRVFVEFFTHSGELRSLSGKYICFHTFRISAGKDKRFRLTRSDSSKI